MPSKRLASEGLASSGDAKNEQTESPNMRKQCAVRAFRVLKLVYRTHGICYTQPKKLDLSRSDEVPVLHEHACKGKANFGKPGLVVLSSRLEGGGESDQQTLVACGNETSISHKRQTRRAQCAGSEKLNPWGM